MTYKINNKKDSITINHIEFEKETNVYDRIEYMKTLISDKFAYESFIALIDDMLMDNGNEYMWVQKLSEIDDATFIQKIKMYEQMFKHNYQSKYGDDYDDVFEFATNLYYILEISNIKVDSKNKEKKWKPIIIIIYIKY